MQTHLEQRPIAPNARVTLEIIGLSCGGDAVRLERDLAKLPGVSRVSVNPLTEMAYLVRDPVVTDVDDVIAAVRRSGFDAHRLGRDENLPEPS